MHFRIPTVMAARTPAGRAPPSASMVKCKRDLDSPDGVVRRAAATQLRELVRDGAPARARRWQSCVCFTLTLRLRLRGARAEGARLQAVNLGVIGPLLSMVDHSEEDLAQQALGVLLVLSAGDAGRDAVNESDGVSTLTKYVLEATREMNRDGAAFGCAYALATLGNLFTKGAREGGARLRSGRATHV